jgi:transposase
LTTKIHIIVSDEKTSIVRQLSPGSDADDPLGQESMEQGPPETGKDKPIAMDKAYEGDACRKKEKKCGMRPVVPPKSNRKRPWKYDKKLYKGRNVVERNFRNIKQFRRVFTRYDKLDETYNAFIAIAYACMHLKN